MARRQSSAQQSSYTLISGFELAYPAPSREMTRFLARLRDAVNDRAATDDDMRLMIYSRDNPLLGRAFAIGPERVTRAAATSPMYEIMIDLLARKQIQSGVLDIDEISARYTLTVADVARARGLSESAIRRAIGERRLSSWLRDDTSSGFRGRQVLHYLDPDEVAAFETSPRGAAFR